MLGLFDFLATLTEAWHLTIHVCPHCDVSFGRPQGWTQGGHSFL